MTKLSKAFGAAVALSATLAAGAVEARGWGDHHHGGHHHRGHGYYYGGPRYVAPYYPGTVYVQPSMPGSHYYYYTRPLPGAPLLQPYQNPPLDPNCREVPVLNQSGHFTHFRVVCGENSDVQVNPVVPQMQPTPVRP